MHRIVRTSKTLSPQSGGFSMLHCASLMGNTQIVLMLLQLGADLMALTDVNIVFLKSMSNCRICLCLYQ